MHLLAENAPERRKRDICTVIVFQGCNPALHFVRKKYAGNVRVDSRGACTRHGPANKRYFGASISIWLHIFDVRVLRQATPPVSCCLLIKTRVKSYFGVFHSIWSHLRRDATRRDVRVLRRREQLAPETPTTFGQLKTSFSTEGMEPIH